MRSQPVQFDFEHRRRKCGIHTAISSGRSLRYKASFETSCGTLTEARIFRNDCMGHFSGTGKGKFRRYVVLFCERARTDRTDKPMLALNLQQIFGAAFRH